MQSAYYITESKLVAMRFIVTRTYEFTYIRKIRKKYSLVNETGCVNNVQVRVGLIIDFGLESLVWIIGEKHNKHETFWP